MILVLRGVFLIKNPGNLFLVLFQNSQTFPFYRLTLGGLSSSGKAQCHNRIYFGSSNCMIKAYIFSAVVWLRDRGNRGDTHLAFNITRSMVPLLPSATIHPLAHLRSGFQVLASPKKPEEQLLTSRNVVNHVIR